MKDVIGMFVTVWPIKKRNDFVLFVTKSFLFFYHKKVRLMTKKVGCALVREEVSRLKSSDTNSALRAKCVLIKRFNVIVYETHFVLS